MATLGCKECPCRACQRIRWGRPVPASCDKPARLRDCAEALGADAEDVAGAKDIGRHGPRRDSKGICLWERR